MCMDRKDLKPWAYVHDEHTLYEVLEVGPLTARMTDVRTDQTVNIGVTHAEKTLTLVRAGIDPNKPIDPADVRAAV